MTEHRKISFAYWCRRYLLNFNLIVVTAVLVYILFFTDNSLQATYTYENEVARLRRELKNENDTLEFYRALNRSISSDPRTLERVAREQYHMQRPHEDIYVIR